MILIFVCFFHGSFWHKPEMLEARAASMRRCWWPYLRQKASCVSSFFANTMVILPLKTAENYRVHFISWDVEKGHQRMHYIRQQVFRRPHVCSTWDCSKLRLGHMRLLILQGVQVFHVIQFYILNNAKVDTKRMNNWMVQKQLPYQLVITLDCFLCSQASRAAQDSWWFMMKHDESSWNWSSIVIKYQ